MNLLSRLPSIEKVIAKMTWQVIASNNSVAEDKTVIPGRAEREPGISRFRVWSFGPSRNDETHLSARQARV
jgi:hypothetical protein